MPASDLVLNVRQIAGYPPSAVAPGDVTLVQRGGLGGPYVSLNVAETVADALAQGGGPLQVGVPAPGDAGPNGLFVNYICSNLGLGLAFNAYHAFPDQWNYYASAPAAAINLTAAGAIEFAVNDAGPAGSPLAWNVVGYLGPLGNMQITGELTLGADPTGPLGAVTAQYLAEAVGALEAATVWTFNGRRGDILLSLSDVIGAGGAPLFSPRFEGSPRAETPDACSHSTRLATTAFVHRNSVLYINKLLNDHPFVFSFNGRTGDVTLTPEDIGNVEGALLNSPALNGVPTAPTAPAGTSTDQLATTQFVGDAVATGIAGLSDVYAPIDSPSFTGYATAPTAAIGSSTAQLATTAFVAAAVAASVAGVASFNTRTGNVSLEASDITNAGGALIESPIFTGQPQGPTAAPGDNSDKLATTAWVTQELGGANIGVMTFNGRGGAVVMTGADVSAAGGALLNSPALTGVPTAPTAATNTTTDQLATCAYVQNALGALDTGVVSFMGRTGVITLTANDISAAGGAVLSSPAFTGTPQAPTAPLGTSSTQLATTAFVMAAIAAGGGVATFNGRAGNVLLTSTDVNAAGGPYLQTAGGAVTGPLTAPTPAATDNSTNVATTAWVQTFSAPRQNRNRLLNAQFNVDQWNNFAGIVPTTGQFVCDRWRAASQSPASGRYSSQAATFGPSVQSQSYRCLNLIQTGTVTTGAATDAQGITQAIEWQNVGDLRWGTPAAKPVTLSFWAQIANFGAAGSYTLSGSIRNFGSTRSYPFTYSVPALGIGAGGGGWTYVSITIPGDQAPAFIGAAVNSTDGFFYVTFDVGSGANLRGPPNAWASGNYYGVSGAVGPANVGVAGALLQLANIQLEAGTTATPFDWKSTAQDFIECQRYFYVSTPTIIWCGNANAGTNYYLYVAFNQTMRIAPTMTTVGSTNVSGFPAGTPPTIGSTDQNGFRAYANANASGAGLYFSFGFTANSEI